MQSKFLLITIPDKTLLSSDGNKAEGEEEAREQERKGRGWGWGGWRRKSLAGGAGRRRTVNSELRAKKESLAQQ